jgi:hypothetical protein
VAGSPGGRDGEDWGDEEMPAPYPGAVYCGACGVFDCGCPKEWSTDYEDDRELHGAPLWDDGCD